MRKLVPYVLRIYPEKRSPLLIEEINVSLPYYDVNTKFAG